MTPFDLCPAPPDWRLDWPAVRDACPWLADLDGCGQDAVNHGEGDVGTHTRMVCEALAGLPAWRGLDAGNREVVFAAALLHDIAKPACRREEADGHISFRGHSRRGAIRARAILWDAGVSFARREAVCGLVRHHLAPFHLAERGDAERVAIAASQTARGDWLAVLAEADARGRVCRDLPRLLDNIALFAEQCRESGCLDRPRPFASDHARVLYFRDPSRHPDAPAHDDCRCDVLLMSGLPAAGKDHWLRAHGPGWPVVSLDDLRDELAVDPADDQGEVVTAARDRARAYLRAGEPFVWNATNLSRQLRGIVLRLCADYRARVRIVYRETTAERLRARNRARSRPVPERVIARLLERWEMPDVTEAHAVEYVVDTQ
ncbi:MAG: AAA family ATPase [Gemmataceae bacterium]